MVVLLVVALVFALFLKGRLPRGNATTTGGINESGMERPPELARDSSTISKEIPKSGLESPGQSSESI
jgi:hypothetical protein